MLNLLKIIFKTSSEEDRLIGQILDHCNNWQEAMWRTHIFAAILAVSCALVAGIVIAPEIFGKLEFLPKIFWIIVLTAGVTATAIFCYYIFPIGMRVWLDEERDKSREAIRNLLSSYENGGLTLLCMAACAQPKHLQFLEPLIQNRLNTMTKWKQEKVLNDVRVRIGTGTCTLRA